MLGAGVDNVGINLGATSRASLDTDSPKAGGCIRSDRPQELLFVLLARGGRLDTTSLCRLLQQTCPKLVEINPIRGVI